MPMLPVTDWTRLKANPRDAEAWLARARHYAALDLPWQAGYAARQAHRLSAPLRTVIATFAPASWHDAAAGDGQLGRSDLVNAGELAGRFSSVVDAEPADWLTWLYLARLHDLPGATSRCAGALERALALEIIAGESRHWLGVWRLSAGDGPGAVAALSPLVTQAPVRCGSMMYLGEALLRTGQVAAAEKAFTRASGSSNPDFLLNLANRVYGHNYWQEAIALLHKAIELRPEHVPGWLALARIQSEVHQVAGCRTSLDRIEALAPGHPEAALLAAGLHGRMGDAHRHYAELQRRYEQGGDPRSRLASSLAMTSLYQDTLSPAEIAMLHRKLCAPIETGVRSTVDFANDCTPERRLRIGYVTGDLHRQHPVNLFLLPILQRHDHEAFEIAIYHTGTMQDDYTRQARACADRWCDAASLDDTALHRVIVADCIDVLVDLAGHTASHRLGVFVLRGAPVQASFLGYPASTGLSGIDWLIGDAIVTPAGAAALYAEGIAQLPGSVFCWAPVDDYPLPPPRAPEAPLVLGSFNNAMKITPATIALWAAVLKAIPEARLVLKAPSLHDATVQARFAGLFAREGIVRERIEFRGPTGLADMMREYGDIDIALDPLPYNGGTTTLQALWMGVPVISLAGGNFVGRMGASFLSTLGAPDWIAQDRADYVAKVQALARDPDALRQGRAALRQRMRFCRLSDIASYVDELEKLFRRMWRNYCAGQPSRLILAEEPAHGQ